MIELCICQEVETLVSCKPTYIHVKYMSCRVGRAGRRAKARRARCSKAMAAAGRTRGQPAWPKPQLGFMRAAGARAGWRCPRRACPRPSAPRCAAAARGSRRLRARRDTSGGEGFEDRVYTQRSNLMTAAAFECAAVVTTSRRVEVWCSTSGAEGEPASGVKSAIGGRSKCSRLGRLSLKFLTVCYMLPFVMYLEDVCPACVRLAKEHLSGNA